MLFDYQAILITFHFFAGHAMGLNGCRQCTGTKIIIFNNPVSEDQAMEFFKTSLGNCATGDDYDAYRGVAEGCQLPCVRPVVGPRTTSCAQFGPVRCPKWTFTLKMWRYCGNGGSVTLNKSDHCSAGVCAISDNLRLVCTRSVRCLGDCNCAECGC